MTAPRTIISRATAADDGELRRLLREVQMKGHIELAFTREPDYFSASQVEGDTIDVMVARDTVSGKIVGQGSRAEKGCFLNGRPDRIGYLSALRVDMSYRKSTLLGRGFRYLKKLHQTGSVKYYLTSIIEDNQAAKTVLTSAKAGLPIYHDLGRFHTLAVRPQKKSSPGKSTDLTIRRAHHDDIKEIAEFLQRNGKNRQFYPVYKVTHFDKDSGLLKNLKVRDIYIATIDGRLVGTLGVWNQKSYKQCVIMKYSRSVRIIRGLINLCARLQKKPGLPGQGKTLDYLPLALICIENDDAKIFERLFSRALFDACAVENLHSVMVGLHERDPFLPVVKRIPHREYLSRIYLVYWQDEQMAGPDLDDKIPYLELGAF